VNSKKHCGGERTNVHNRRILANGPQIDNSDPFPIIGIAMQPRISFSQSSTSLPLDEEALRDQLCSTDWSAPDGRILSWINGANAGYPYDEATALFARLFRWMGASQLESRCVSVLERRLAASGWLGRDGTHYVFDTALSLPLVREPAPLADRIVQYLSRGWACQPATEPGRWSQSWGPHLLRCLPPLAQLGHTAFCDSMASRIVDTCFGEGRFRISSQSDLTYLHAHCYALEGLMGLGGYDEVVRAGTRWLALQQDADGSMPRWSGDGAGDRTSDVVAQSIRLWSIVDREAFAPSVDRGLRWLGSMQGTDGLIRYSPTSNDRCSWANAFALQAIRWAALPSGTQPTGALV
jgi:hypothetical protein